MTTPAPAGCPGIDVSQFQRVIDWAKVRDSGVRFAFIRAADALYRDPLFAANWAGARDAGILRGVYQFFRADRAALPQADLVLELLAQHGAGELPPVLDVESAYKLTADRITDAACEWIDHVHVSTEVRPILYTMPGFAPHLHTERLAECPLWVAHVDAQTPIVPRGWQRWDFWQHSWHGVVPGIEKHVDLDVYAGTFAELCTAYGVIA
jgi:lysozyme